MRHPDKAAYAENAAISLYKGTIPPSAAATMERLYEHIYSSLGFLELYGNLGDDTHTYIARKDGEEVAVLLFHFDGKKVRVLNEQITIEAGEIERFARYVFATFASASSILFCAIDTWVQNLPFPFQRFKCSEDFVLKLPDSAQTYLASLGKSTRSYIKRYQNKLQREFPSHRFSFHMAQEASEQDIRQIIALNRARMAEKNKSSDIDDLEVERIIRLVRRSGAVGLISIDGRICAGTINYRCGENYFLRVIGHDPQYNDYRIGMLCCYFTICACIAQGSREYHFMWGRYDYKSRLSGAPRDLHQLAIYPTRRHMLLNGSMALKIAYSGYALKTSRWLLHKARAEIKDDSIGSRLLFRGLHGLRKLKRFGVAGAIRKKKA
jgi:hypothetical protein